MRLFVSGATATLRRHLGSPYLGALVVPGAGNRVDPLLTAGVPWAADNAAFTGFDAARFCRMLGRIAGHPGCRFVACPDVVGDAAATLRRFAVWSPVIRALGLPVALVAQDGLERLAVSWDDLDALFIGGSTEWKLGPHAAAVAREAKQRGKWSHFGRCNTRKRFRHAYQLGCDSIDGSGFSRWPDQRIPLALGWLQRLHGESDDALLAAAAPDFFRGGLGDHLLARPGWTVERVSSGTGGYLVHARFRHEPVSCPGCARPAPDATRLAGHGGRTTRVWDHPRHGRPVRLALTRSRFRCTACGHTFAPLPEGIHPAFRLTQAAVKWIAAEAERLPADEISLQAGVNGRTIRRVRRRANTGVVPSAPAMSGH